MLKSYSGTEHPEPEDVADFDLVAADPAAFYDSPEAIVADQALTRRQRLRLLDEWAQDLIDQQVADNEGMAPQAPQSAVETGLLRRVNASIESVEATPEENTSLVARVWRRLTAI